MDPIEERDIEKMLVMLDDERIKKKMLDLFLNKLKLNIDVRDLVKSEDFKLGVKSIIAEYHQEKIETQLAPKKEEPEKHESSNENSST